MPGLAIASPDAAMALASPVGFRFLFDPDARRHGIFLVCEIADEAIDTASESMCRGCNVAEV